VILIVVTDALLAVVFVASIYSLMSGNPKHRRRSAQRIAVLAMSGVLLSEAHTRSGWSHWMNLGIGVFGIASVLLQAVLDRRKMSRKKPVPESTASSLGGYKRPTGY
jgi:hypothetical protein